MTEARICLLRGVNVGGVKVPMAELRELAAGAGLANPRTLLASGNLVVDSGAPPAEVEGLLETALEARFGRRIDVVVRTPDQWRRLIAANPFPDQAAEHGSRLLVVIMRSPIPEETAERLAALATEDEKAEVRHGDLFLWCPDGLGRSKLAEAASRPLKGLVGTGRNWNTVLKLAALAAV